MKVLTHRFIRVLAGALVVAALIAPSAGAVPTGPDRVDTGEPFVVEPSPAPVVQLDEGFDWASAAIGAGGAGALLLLVSAGGLGYRHRHQHIGAAH
jgi:hypothetical protein